MKEILYSICFLAVWVLATYTATVVISFLLFDLLHLTGVQGIMFLFLSLPVGRVILKLIEERR